MAESGPFHAFELFRVDPAARALPADERARGVKELCACVEEARSRLEIRTYGLVGLRPEADLLLWLIGPSFAEVHDLVGAFLRTPLGPYLSLAHCYLSLERPSPYTRGEIEQPIVEEGPKDYLFVYPFVKSRAWYRLPFEERQEMMREHIRVSQTFTRVRLNTTYSFGLGDQDFIVAFETNDPGDFEELVRRLRETRASEFTVRDTPLFVCLRRDLRQILAACGL